jgi:hypothetical protein
MSWMEVSIGYKDATAHKAAMEAFMDKVSAEYRAAGAPKGAVIYHKRIVFVSDVFYFSPVAAAVFEAVLAEFGAVACAEPTNLKSLTDITLSRL